MTKLKVILTSENGTVLDEFFISEADRRKQNNKPPTEVLLSHAVRDELEYLFEVTDA